MTSRPGVPVGEGDSKAIIADDKLTRLPGIDGITLTLSADGRRMAWVPYGNQSPNMVIHVANMDGSAKKSLTPGMFPTWAPDSRSIAFLGEHDLEVFAIDADGGTPRPLARGPQKTLNRKWLPGPYVTWRPRQPRR